MEEMAVGLDHHHLVEWMVAAVDHLASSQKVILLLVKLPQVAQDVARHQVEDLETDQKIRLRVGCRSVMMVVVRLVGHRWAHSRAAHWGLVWELAVWVFPSLRQAQP